MFFAFKNINLFAEEMNQNRYSPNNKLTENKITIEGDSLENILDRKLRASGNVTVSKGNQSITADFIEYDQISEELYAKGKIRITTPNLQLKGAELEMSMAENTGLITNGSFIADINQNSTSKFNKKLRGTATRIFIEGEDKKKLENAKVTTCEAGQDEWYITSGETLMDQSSGNIKAKDALLSLRGVPIMYSPYVDFSITSERRSGWLLPTTGSTTMGGFENSIPYYFNLSPTYDATLTTRNMSKRGLQFDGEFRYLNQNFSF